VIPAGPSKSGGRGDDSCYFCLWSTQFPTRSNLLGNEIIMNAVPPTLTSAYQGASNINQRRLQISKSLICLIRNEFRHLDWTAASPVTDKIADSSPFQPFEMQSSIVVHAPKITIKKELDLSSSDIGIRSSMTPRGKLFVRRSSEDDSLWPKAYYKGYGTATLEKVKSEFVDSSSNADKERSKLDTTEKALSKSCFRSDNSKDDRGGEDDERYSAGNLLHGNDSMPFSSGAIDSNVVDEGMFVDFGTDDTVEANASSSSARQQQISASLIRLIHSEFEHIDWNTVTPSSSPIAISSGVNEEMMTGTTTSIELDATHSVLPSVNPSCAASTSFLLDDQGDSYDTVANLLSEGVNMILSESPTDEIKRHALTTSKDSVAVLEKQQRITLSLRNVIQQEFSHISWDCCPENVLPPRRVVDWTARVDPIKEGIPVDWNFVYSQLANKRTACLDRSFEIPSDCRLRTNQRNFSLAEHDKTKQRLLSQSLLRLIKKEFDHINWDYPLPLKPCRRVVDANCLYSESQDWV